GDVQIARDFEVGKRAGQTRVRQGEAVHAQVATVEQPGQLGNSGTLQAQSHVELVFRMRGGMEHAARTQLSEVLRSTIGAGGRTGKANHDVAALVGVDIDIG